MQHSRKELRRIRAAFEKTWERVKDSPSETRFDMKRFAHHLFQTGYHTATNDLCRDGRQDVHDLTLRLSDEMRLRKDAEFALDQDRRTEPQPSESK